MNVLYQAVGVGAGGAVGSILLPVPLAVIKELRDLIVRTDPPSVVD